MNPENIGLIAFLLVGAGPLLVLAWAHVYYAFRERRCENLKRRGKDCG